MATFLKLSSVSQITIPSSLRARLGVKPGDELEVDIVGNILQLQKARTLDEQIDEMFAEFDRINKKSEKRMTPEQKKKIEKMKGWTINQYHEHFDNTPERKAYIKEKYGL